PSRRRRSRSGCGRRSVTGLLVGLSITAVPSGTPLSQLVDVNQSFDVAPVQLVVCAAPGCTAASSAASDATASKATRRTRAGPALRRFDPACGLTIRRCPRACTPSPQKKLQLKQIDAPWRRL